MGVRSFGFSVLLFLILEAVVFRSGLYFKVLAPDSKAGTFQYTVAAERARPPSGKVEVLVLGDSRVTEGFSEKIADSFLSGQSLKLINGAIPGATPRVWFYQLRALDPERRKYAGVVLLVGDYRDYDYGREDLWADGLSDSRYLATVLTFSDLPEFVFSYHRADRRRQVFLELLLKGLTFKDDLHDFLRSPSARIRKRAAYDKGFRLWRYEYPGRDATLAGLAMGQGNNQVVFPAGMSAARRREVSRHLGNIMVEKTGNMERFNRRWLGRIAGFYRGSPTRVIFARLPAHPFFPRYHRQPDPSCVVCELTAAGLVTALPSDAFVAVERQDNFSDTLHLNRSGREEFSRRLAGAVSEEFFAAGRGVDHVF